MVQANSESVVRDSEFYKEDIVIQVDLLFYTEESCRYVTLANLAPLRIGGERPFPCRSWRLPSVHRL
jgi:hypothetical protein